MTETPPTAPASQPSARGRLGGYVAVAVIALVVGGAAMFAGLRWPALTGRRPSSTTATTPASPPAPHDEEAVSDGQGVYISPARQQLIGVRTAAVERRVLAESVRATGTLAYDQTRVTQVHAKIAGWIDQLFVDFVGKPVQAGQPLFTIYSPDLVSTQNEYLLARKAQDALSGSRFEETRTGAASLFAAARKRLELWDISPAQIADLERTGEPRRTLTLYAPSSGVVLERNAFTGQYISPETNVFTLADLSTVWAIGQVPESQAGLVRVGQPVSVELTNEPGSRPVQGHVGFIYPDVDPATRRIRIRVDVPNPHLALRPDAFVTMTIAGPTEPALAVPAEAVIDTGTKQYVILARGRGYFEPRVIETGTPTLDYYPAIRGLAAGDQVVTSAQFLIDSETNLQAAMQAMADGPASATPPAPAAAKEPAPVAIDFRTDPAPIRLGDNTFDVTVKDRDGRGVTDAEVSVTFFMAGMPAMGMPDMRLVTPLARAADGVYRAAGQVPMPGRWDVTVAVTRGGARIGNKHFALVVP